MIETEKTKTKQEIIQEKIESLVARNKIYSIISILIIGGYFYDPPGDDTLQILFLPLALILFSVINYFEIQKYREELNSNNN